MLPPGLSELAQDLLTDFVGSPVKIERASSIGGGSINQALKLQTTQGSYFLKYNSAQTYPQMFELELKGLSELHKANEIYIPQAIGTRGDEQYTFLLMEFVESGLRNRTFWEDFGISLAKLHRHSATHFGLGHDNYIGSLEQANMESKSWSEFFIRQRLEPQIRLASLPSDVAKMFDRLFKKMEEIFPIEPPSLLHGDLWSGNYMTSEQGFAALIDPAVYYGHREMDIAMTKLFGGFEGRFYSAYQETFPMENGWEERLDICNLYPLMVHVNLFGGSYLQQVKSILNKYTG